MAGWRRRAYYYRSDSGGSSELLLGQCLKWFLCQKPRSAAGEAAWRWCRLARSPGLPSWIWLGPRRLIVAFGARGAGHEYVLYWKGLFFIARASRLYRPRPRVRPRTHSESSCYGHLGPAASNGSGSPVTVITVTRPARPTGRVAGAASRASCACLRVVARRRAPLALARGRGWWCSWVSGLRESLTLRVFCCSKCYCATMNLNSFRLTCGCGQRRLVVSKLGLYQCTVTGSTQATISSSSRSSLTRTRRANFSWTWNSKLKPRVAEKVQRTETGPTIVKVD